MVEQVLVTGAMGVVGQALTRELRDRGYHVVGVDLSHGLDEVAFQVRQDDPSPAYVRCDVAEYRELARVCDLMPFDFVYHAAAEFGRWSGEDWYERVWRTNCIGTRHMLEMQREHGFRCVYFSSSEVYGDLSGVMTEGATERGCVQLNDYAISKWANELQVRNQAQQHGTESVVVRLFNTYGPGEYYSPYRSVVCRMCYCAVRGLPFVVHRGHERSHLWIGDCVRALANLADDGRFHPGQVYNICSMAMQSIEALAARVFETAGAAAELVSYVDTEPMTVRTKRADNAAARHDLGFEETVDLDEGIRRTVEWMRRVYGP